MLKVKATICPCLITQEDRTALSSIQILSSVLVMYHDPASTDAAAFSIRGSSIRQLSGALNAKVGKFVSGLMSATQEEEEEEDNEEEETKQDTTMGNNSSNSSTLSSSGLARLVVVDTVNGPAFSIEQTMSGRKTNTKTVLIPMHTIGEISPCDSFTSSIRSSLSSSALSSSSSCGIYLFARRNNDKQDTDATHTELCRLDLKQDHNNNHQFHRHHDDLDSTRRDEVMEALTFLIQWSDAKGLLPRMHTTQPQVQNQTQNDENYNNGNGYSTAGSSSQGGIGQRALKIKHFAQREIELAKKKRDRESRKARYLKESGGGLKYTAIAMANREMS